MISTITTITMHAVVLLWIWIPMQRDGTKAFRLGIATLFHPERDETPEADGTPVSDNRGSLVLLLPQREPDVDLQARI